MSHQYQFPFLPSPFVLTPHQEGMGWKVPQQQGTLDITKIGGMYQLTGIESNIHSLAGPFNARMLQIALA